MPSSAPPLVFPKNLTVKLNSRFLGAAFNFPVSDGSGIDTTSNTLNGRWPFWAPKTADLTDIIIGFPGYLWNAPEIDWPETYTVTAAIEYPAGTYTPVYTNTGSRTLTVNPGRLVARFEPDSSGLVIPRGANAWIKFWLSWTPGTFYGNSGVVTLAGSLMSAGTNLADQTLTTISGGTQTIGVSPLLEGRLSNPIAVLGILGTSHDRGSGDLPDPNSGGAIAWARALRGNIPCTVIARVGMMASVYFQRVDGTQIIFRDGITHLLYDMITNDIYLSSITLATAQAYLQQGIAPFLARGIKVWTATVMPRTTSTDVWITTANQTISNTAANNVRLAYNTWIRANWQSLGLSGLLDASFGIDPTDTSLLAPDPNPIASAITLAPQRAWATMSGGSVVSMALANGAVSGAAFPASSSIPCIVRNMPGDTTGNGAVVNGLTNGSGQITSWQVVSGGSNYFYPPLIAPATRRTLDGIHLTCGGYDAAIVATGFAPELLTF